MTDGLMLLEEHRELSGKSNHYPFLDVPEKIRFASEMKAPRSSAVPLIAVLLGMFLVVAVPIGLLVAKRYARPEGGKTVPTGDSATEHPVAGSVEKNEGGSDAVRLDLKGIVKVPEGQLERIRNQQQPEVRRAEVVVEEAPASDNDGNDPGGTADIDEEGE